MRTYFDFIKIYTPCKRVEQNHSEIFYHKTIHVVLCRIQLQTLWKKENKMLNQLSFMTRSIFSFPLYLLLYSNTNQVWGKKKPPFVEAYITKTYWSWGWMIREKFNLYICVFYVYISSTSMKMYKTKLVLNHITT